MGLASTELINVDIHTSCSVSPYPFAISRHASVVTPTGIVTCGGRHKSKHLNTCKRLTSSGNWASFPSMISKRSRYGLLMMNGLLWAVGGYGGKEMPWSTMEYIDPRNPTEWTLKSMPFDVGGHCLTELSNQRLMVTGGYRSGTVKNIRTGLHTLFFSQFIFSLLSVLNTYLTILDFSICVARGFWTRKQEIGHKGHT